VYILHISGLKQAIVVELRQSMCPE